MDTIPGLLPAIHEVGAKPMALPDNVKASAVYGGPLDCYRYRLAWRPKHWALDLEPERRSILWLMMNPSVAGHDCADRTVLKCWTFSRAWGFTDMLVGNSAAYRATDQSRLAEVPDPIGWENAAHLMVMAREAHMIIVAYGLPKVKAARRFGPDAVRPLREAGMTLHTLARSNDGTPGHPLFLAGSLKPRIWNATPTHPAVGDE